MAEDNHEAAKFSIRTSLYYISTYSKETLIEVFNDEKFALEMISTRDPF